VSAKFDAGENISVGLLTNWVAESFRLISPKKLSETIES
jgi:hypothetical protein